MARSIPRDRCGVTGGLGYPEENTDLSALGVGWLRMPLNWAQVETPDARARVRAWCENLHALCPKVRLLLTFRASRDGGRPTPMPDLREYRLALTAVVQEMRPFVGAWQIENEEDSSTWWAGTFSQYLGLLAAAYEIIHPTGALVLMGGFTSEITNLGWMIATKKMTGTPAQLATLAEYQRLLPTAACDATDIHCYHEHATVKARVTWFAGISRKPVWATELGGPDSRVATYSEAAQATDLPARLRAALDGGAQRVMWLGLRDQGTQGQVYDQMALIRPDGTRKPAFGAYQKTMGR